MPHTTFSIRVAGQVFAVRCRFAGTRERCAAYLTDDAAAFALTLTDAAPDGLPDCGDPAGREFIALHRVVCRCLFPLGFLLFHASAVCYDGTAYLFTAPSGTGKSTHTALWCRAFPEHAAILNDDKPLLQYADGGFRVFGSPWCGKENRSMNASAPLGGIVLLHQAPDNRIAPLSPEAAFPLFLRQTYLPDDPAQKLAALERLDRLCRSAPVFSMGCNISREAAVLSRNALLPDEKR